MTLDTTTSPASPGSHAAAPDKPILFFDGVCGLCNRSIDFVIAKDRQARLRVAPLQGETASRLLDPAEAQHLGTVILRDGDRTYRRSAAAVRVLWKLGGFWTVLGGLLWLIPLPLRDLGYRLIAANRYRLFGKKETCRLPTPAERERFLP